jgi:hypothetical protein
MVGFIRKREVILNAGTVIRGFGLRVFVRCLLARRGATFLSLLGGNYVSGHSQNDGQGSRAQRAA